MDSTKLILTILVCSMLYITPVVAQEPQLAKPTRDTSLQEVTIVIQRQQIRFTAPVNAQELRLEVHDKNGELVYDSGFVMGGDLSWALRNSSGGEIPSSLYGYTLTIKKTDDEAPITRRGHMILERGRDQLWVTNNGAIGAEETVNGGDLTVSSGAEASLAGARIGKGGTIVNAPTNPLYQVTHDGTLSGDGTDVSPLGIADGGVRARKIAAGQVVKNLNGLTDEVSLTAGTNISITSSGNNLNIAAPNLLGSVTHDTTLAGSGTSDEPLSVSIPLNLVATSNVPIISVTNSNSQGTGLFAKGRYGIQTQGADHAVAQAGWGMFAQGGRSVSGSGGIGMQANGGGSDSSQGGAGMSGLGGNSIRGPGGFGGSAEGGISDSGPGGTGIGATGGHSNTGYGGRGANLVGGRSESGPGGEGLQGLGGSSNSNSAGPGAYLYGGYSNIGYGGPGAYLQGGNSSTGYGGYGIYAAPGSGPAGKSLAGLFVGNVSVSGNLSKGGGSFKIDHPLDPANKYLYHSFVESPDMMNVYNGNVTTDANGDATVTLPDYFEALNRDFRYQLTVIGQFAQAIVASKVNGNRFTIKTDRPGVEVSWQVTGIRQDAYANKHRIPVEEAKPERERGYYLHPQVFDQPEEKSLEWARNTEMMRQIKIRRQEAELEMREKKNDR
jgi:trimeric autotransporter adhesin